MFCERLRQSRISAGLSQKELAARLFISQQAYAKYELGTSSPNPETLAKIAEQLSISVDYLLGREQKEKAPAETGERAIGDDDIKLALFGGDGEVTDAMWDEALFAIQLIKERHKREKEKNG